MIPRIERIIFNDPATIVFFKDGDKQVVKCSEDDIFDEETGVAMAIVNKLYGNRTKFLKDIKRKSSENHSLKRSHTALKSKFDVDDIVNICDTGRLYTTYVDFFDHCLVNGDFGYISKNLKLVVDKLENMKTNFAIREDPHLFSSRFVIECIAEHELIKGEMLYIVRDINNDKYYIVGEDGLESLNYI